MMKYGYQNATKMGSGSASVLGWLSPNRDRGSNGWPRKINTNMEYIV